MAVKIVVKDLDKLTALADKFPHIADKYVTMAIRRSLTRILGTQKTEAPFGVTGQLRDRWELNVSSFKGILRSQMPYSIAVHEGTKPHYVSAERLAPWAKNKGLNLYAVSKNIQKFGTAPNPFFERAVRKEEQNVQGEFKNALINLTKELGNAL